MPASADIAPSTRAVAVALLVVAILSCIAFLTLGARGDWGFVLTLRGTRLGGLLLVAVAVAVATVLFQTLTQNRILTPSIMGFDQLFVALQTALVFALGSRDVAGLDPRLRFVLETGAMVALALLLFRWLFGGSRRSLHLLVLAGIVFGLLFRSMSSLMQRILDPNEFAVLQDGLFASFNRIEPDLLLLGWTIVLPLSWIAWTMRRELDVIALGRETAVGLGVEHGSVALRLLAMIAVLVSVSTALAGPVAFLGLLVANAAYAMVGDRHGAALPAAVLTAIVVLVGGQTLLERVFGYDTPLGIIVEFFGGLVFIGLVLRGVAR